MWRHPKRDLIMFWLGAAGFLHELLIAAQERPYIIAGCFALMGLPFVLNGDVVLQRRNGRNGKNGSRE